MHCLDPSRDVNPSQLLDSLWQASHDLENLQQGNVWETVNHEKNLVLVCIIINDWKRGCLAFLLTDII